MEINSELINGKSWKVGTIEVNWNGNNKKIKIRRISEGMKNDINAAAIKVRMVGNSTDAVVNHVLLKEMSLVKGIIDAPFQISQEEIRDLDPELVQEIWDAYQELNQVVEKKNQADS